MTLPPEAIQEFAEIYRQAHGVVITAEEASQRAHAFINLYRAVCDVGNDH